MCWFSWPAWLMKEKFYSLSTLLRLASVSELWKKSIFTVKTFLTSMLSHKGTSSPRQTMMVSSKSPLLVIVWVPFHFICLLRRSMQDNRWSSTRAPWKGQNENAFVKGHSRLCQLLVWLDCDHTSFFISILLNLPQVSSSQSCQPGKMIPLLCGLHELWRWGARAVRRRPSFIISHSTYLRHADASEPEKKRSWKADGKANISAASAAGLRCL
jgi:hypothetical protein